MRTTHHLHQWHTDNRAVDALDTLANRGLLNSEQVHRIYLDELGDVRSLPLTVAATVLTITDETEAPAAARFLLERTEQETLSERERANLIDIVTRSPLQPAKPIVLTQFQQTVTNPT